MLGLLFDLLRGASSRSRTEERVDGRHCVACESSEVVVLGPRVYRCSACGYEGGSGLARWRRAQRLAAILALDETNRRASAKSDLESARLELLAAIGELGRAQDDVDRVENPPWWQDDEEGGPRLDMAEQHSAIQNGQRHLLAGIEHIEDAATKLRIELVPRDLDARADRWFLGDFDLRLGGVLRASGGRDVPSDGMHRAHAALRWVDVVEQRYFGSGCR